MSPTYELALQTGKVIEQMGKYYPEVKLVYAIRGNKCKFGFQHLSVKMTCSSFTLFNCKKKKSLVSFSATRHEAAGADSHWYTWYNAGLVQ